MDVMFQDLLNRLIQPQPAPIRDADARLALTALLVRVARSDNHYSGDEKALIDALDAAAPKAAAAIEAEDFEGAMAALATLRTSVDAFFDTVVVNAPDAEKREARLALLARFRDAVHQVADFSRIEG